MFDYPNVHNQHVNRVLERVSRVFSCPRFLVFTLQQLSQLELLCEQLYESQEPGVRLQAEKALVGFTESQESLPQCQMVLERSQVRVV